MELEARLVEGWLGKPSGLVRGRVSRAATQRALAVVAAALQALESPKADEGETFHPQMHL